MNKRITCKRCFGKGYIYVTFSEGNTGTATSCTCPECSGVGFQFVPSTNAERIRSMSDEELSEFFCPDKPHNSPWCEPVGKVKCGKAPCRKCMMDWLQQPAEEEQL